MQELVLLSSSISLLSLTAACAIGSRPFVSPFLRSAPAKTPVVLVAGTTGTKLRERESKRVRWGNALNLFRPHDRGYTIALPLDAGSSSYNRLEAYAPVLEIRFLFWKVQAYGSILRLMERNGYKGGDLRSPEPDENFFFFSYDWRHNNLAAVEQLGRRLEALRLARKEEVLKINLICQSNASRICRYYAKYGTASLEEAETHQLQLPAKIRVEKLLLVGTSNGGSLRVLHEMNRGRQYVPWIGRRWSPETLFTVRSLYEDLPIYREDLFFDADGNLLEIDIFEAENWQRYGWSIYGRAPRRRLRHNARPDLFLTPNQRAQYLQETLRRARRFQHLLNQDAPGFTPGHYYLIVNSSTETPDRALLVQEGGKWKTFFVNDDRVRNNSLLHALSRAVGDGHATLRSQNWLSPQEKEALANPPVYVKGGHFEMILNRKAQRYLLQFLAADPVL